MVFVDLLETEYNISEGDVIRFCVLLVGAIDREVVVNISTQDVESALGEFQDLM